MVVELSSTGEKETNIELIRRNARKLLGKKDIEIFIPAICQKVRNETQTLFYMSGYIFIKFDPSINYNKLKETNFFKDVICDRRSKSKVPKYSLLADKELDNMRRGMDSLTVVKLKEGDKIKIIKGNFRNLMGEVFVVYENSESVQVRVNLISKPFLADFPVTYLEKINEEGSD